MAEWLTLLRRATAVIDAAAAEVGMFEWTLGGGTMLWLRFRHRESRDLDIFLSDPQLLGALSPRLNSESERIVHQRGGKFIEQSNFLKLAFPEGDIDFIIAPHLTAPYAEPGEIDGRAVMIETPREILGKKLLYRAEDFTARDLFDLAFLIEQSVAESLISSDKRTYLAKLQIIATRVRLLGDTLRRSFQEIRALDYRPSFEACNNALGNFVARHQQAA